MLKKRSFLLFVIIIAFLFLPLGWKKLRGPGIRQFSKMLLEEQIFPLQGEALSALDQPYFYWNKGCQCYVFLSQDQRFVLKIPRKKRQEEVVKSFEIASNAFLSETALVYVHYGKEDLEPPESFALYDKIHRRLQVDLSRHPFALQRRIVLLKDAFDATSSREEEKKLLRQFLHLIEVERSKGWYATDFAFSANIGLEQKEAVRIDIGSYAPIDAQFSWKKITKPVSRYLQKKDPILSLWFEERVQECEQK